MRFVVDPLCGSVTLWLCGSVALWRCGAVALWCAVCCKVEETQSNMLEQIKQRTERDNMKSKDMMQVQPTQKVLPSTQMHAPAHLPTHSPTIAVG